MWIILVRHPALDNVDNSMVKLTLDTAMSAMFPTFARLSKIALVLPVGTASVERSFSSMNLILCSKRTRLTPDHVSIGKYFIAMYKVWRLDKIKNVQFI